jgi:pyruvate kinase
MGGFPFESVKIMSRIIKEAEKIVAPNYEDYSDW